MTRISSISERPISHLPRRLADWLNPTGAKKVHSLVDKVYKMKNLELAWDRVKRKKGAGGIDGESIKDFESNLSGNLKRLHEELKTDTYRPKPCATKTDTKTRQAGRDATVRYTYDI